MSMKKLFFITIWLISIIISIIWSYENPEKIESLKDKFKKNKSPIVENIDSEKKIHIANSFEVHSKKIIKLEDKTAFIIYPEAEKIFSKEKLKIYTQNGFVIENFIQTKLSLPKYFTLQRNGGVKTVIIPKENEKDLSEIPDNIKQGLEIKPVSYVDEALEIALANPLIPIVEDNTNSDKGSEKGLNIEPSTSKTEITAH